MSSVKIPSTFVVLTCSLLLPLALATTAFGQPPASPSPNTVIRPAPPGLCKLLDNPHVRGVMDGLLFNLIWSCGRQNELGKIAGEAETEKADESLPLLKEESIGVTDVRVNNPAGETGAGVTQSETSITQNPVTGTLCSSFNDSGEFYGGGGGFTGFARSTDGGLTWQDRGAVGGSSGGDPSLVWRKTDGRFYLATLASGGALALWVSTDDCQTFSFLSTPSTGGDDKEILAVDNNPASIFFGNLYLAWKDFGVAGAPIRASRSTDGGLTWSAPLTLSTGGTVQGAWPAVAPNGDIFVAWLRYTDFQSGPITVEVSRSTDGGLSYLPVSSPLVNAVSPRDATATINCGRPSLNGNFRYLASPQLAIDNGGTLHIVYSYDPDGFNVGDVVNVYYRRSTNSGSSWGPEVRLNDDVTTRDQYFPTVQVNGSTVITSWYDRRLDANNLLQDYFKRVSYDGGLTWSPSTRVSDVASSIILNPNLATCYHGDYDQSLVSLTSTEVAQWADDRRGDADVYVDAAAPPPPAFTAFASDFESSLSGLALTGLWHLTSACQAASVGHSLPTALYFGIDGQCTYATGTQVTGTATLPPIGLKNLTTPIQLGFKYFLGTEDLNGFDLASIEVSADGGPYQVVASNQPPAGATTLFDPSTGWQSSSANLSAFAGTIASVRLRFDSVDGILNNFPGFYIDDVLVSAAGCQVAENLELQNQSIVSTQTHEACDTVFAGSNLTIEPSGNVTLHAGKRVVLRSGFLVRPGATFKAVVP